VALARSRGSVLSESLPKVRDIQALLTFIEARAATSFGWRKGRDCASFVSLAVEAQTGVDPRGHLHWTSKRSAHQVVAGEGGLEAAFDARFDRVPAALASRGDIAAIADPAFGVRLMIVEGGMLVGPGPSGLERQPRSEMLFAWNALSVRVGASNV
jgi:hypothetical protein